MKLHWALFCITLFSMALLQGCTTPIGEIGLITYQSDADYQFSAPLQATTDCLLAKLEKPATKWQVEVRNYAFINEVMLDQKYPLRAGFSIRLESIQGKTSGILRIHDADKETLLALANAAVKACDGEVLPGTTHRT